VGSIIFAREWRNMHMADALLSPGVGGAMWAVSTGIAAFSIKKIQNDMDEKKIPLMGVMGAFIFAAQMINFSIPGTGSSGHIGGGLLLAILLGPYAGFLTMASILLIQALFFADGGLLAFGSNLFNLAFYAVFIVYPLIYKGLTHKRLTSRRIFVASLLSSVIGLQFGAFSVVLETLFSGKTDLPFVTFVILMQSIHLAIGIVEGLVTAAIVTFVWHARPEILEKTARGEALGGFSIKKILTIFVLGIVIGGGALSSFASANPDGLEWSVLKSAGTTELGVSDGMHKTLSDIQRRIAILPNYGFKSNNNDNIQEVTANKPEDAAPRVSAGTSVSGLVGGALTLALAGGTGLTIRWVKRRKNRVTA
jgi:cobalt/nickel transport system permease protein